jgi:hypothetical protein
MTDSRQRRFAIYCLTGSLALLSCASPLHRLPAGSTFDRVSGAIARSSIEASRKAGCLSSLNFWQDEQARSLTVTRADGGVFVLGDSYLSYFVAVLPHGSPHPQLIVQSGNSTNFKNVSATDHTQLAALLASAPHDPPPQQPPIADHLTCIVFMDRSGEYFPVARDDISDSTRATDRALTLLYQMARGAR